jgi:hypothetical protein
MIHTKHTIITANNLNKIKNIGGDKIYASTKYWHQQNIGVDKNLAPIKYWRRQKLGVDKRWRRRWRISLLLGSAESAAADFSQAPLKISYFSLMVLLSVHAVVKCGVASTCSAFMVVLSPVLYRLIVVACHAENVKNLGADKISASA